MEDNKSFGTVSSEKEMVSPFTMDHEYALGKMRSDMLTSADSADSNVADELNVEKPKSAKPNRRENRKKEPKQSIVKKMIEPFKILPEGSIDPNHKLYLVLAVYQSTEDNVEDTRDFFFEKGRQKVFDKIKEILQSGDSLDVMRSLIYVDSTKVPISKRTSVYRFMKDAIDSNKVLNNTSFDIDDYWYDVEDEERTDIDGEE